MASVPQRELRNHVSDVLRRAESGERLTITVAGRPVAELGPIQPRREVSRADARAALATLPPLTRLLDDLRQTGGGVVDPFTE